MRRIGVGFIGLPGSHPSAYEGVNWAVNAHLPFLTQSPHFHIVALLNTSAESARNAIKKFRLPAETKAYGKPEGRFSNFDWDYSCDRG
jgi:predicted dehydrogenase